MRGATARFTATASGAAPPPFQLYQVIGYPIPGATLTIAPSSPPETAARPLSPSSRWIAASEAFVV